MADSAERDMRAKMSWKGRLANRRKHIAERSGGGKARGKGKDKDKGKGKSHAGRQREREPNPNRSPSPSSSPAPHGADPVVYECEYDCGFASENFAAVERHEQTCASAANVTTNVTATTNTTAADAAAATAANARYAQPPPAPAPSGAAVSPCAAQAARAIADASHILIGAGAGLSADCGLPVYADIARCAAYDRMGLEYDDLCRARWQHDDPAVFFGFWGRCYDEYRKARPHEGYSILRRWCERVQAKGDRRDRDRDESHDRDCAHSVASEGDSVSSWGRERYSYVYTSNVDGMFRRAGFGGMRCPDGARDGGSADTSSAVLPMHEVHGNALRWVCLPAVPCAPVSSAPAPPGDSDSGASTGSRHPPLPQYYVGQDTGKDSGSGGTEDAAAAAFAFGIDRDTMRAGAGAASALAAALVPVPYGHHSDNCNIAPVAEPSHLRPAVLMFGDGPDVYAKLGLQRGADCYQEWEERMERRLCATHAGDCGDAARLVIIEVGCGTRVPTVRNECEEVWRDCNAAAAGSCTLIRINPDADNGGEERTVAGEQEDRDASCASQPQHICVRAGALAALRCIDRYLQQIESNAGADRGCVVK